MIEIPSLTTKLPKESFIYRVLYAKIIRFLDDTLHFTADSDAENTAICTLSQFEKVDATKPIILFLKNTQESRNVPIVLSMRNADLTHQQMEEIAGKVKARLIQK